MIYMYNSIQMWTRCMSHTNSVHVSKLITTIEVNIIM